MSWEEPKTNWTSADAVSDRDFNRIENNIAYLKEEGGGGGLTVFRGMSEPTLTEEEKLEGGQLWLRG